jgi:hypothetical protein
MISYKDSIKDYNQFRILYENTVMILGYVFERAYIIDKILQKEMAIFDFDYDPTCGLIGKNNDWFLIGSDVLMLKTWTENSIRFVGELKNIHSLKAIGDYTVQILTDPWSEQSSIWQMEIDLNKLTRPVKLTRLRDFKDYIGKPYTDEPVW